MKQQSWSLVLSVACVLGAAPAFAADTAIETQGTDFGLWELFHSEAYLVVCPLVEYGEDFRTISAIS